MSKRTSTTDQKSKKTGTRRYCNNETCEYDYYNGPDVTDIYTYHSTKFHAVQFHVQATLQALNLNWFSRIIHKCTCIVSMKMT